MANLVRDQGRSCTLSDTEFRNITFDSKRPMQGIDNI